MSYKKNKPTKIQLDKDLEIIDGKFTELWNDYVKKSSKCPNCGNIHTIAVKICEECGQEINSPMDFFNRTITVIIKLVNDHIERFYTYFDNAEQIKNYINDIHDGFRKKIEGSLFKISKLK